MRNGNGGSEGGEPGSEGPQPRAPYQFSPGRFAGAGIQFGAAIVLFTLAGVWLDKKLGTSPWFTLAGVFLGGFGAFMSLYRRLMDEVRKEEESRKK